MNETRRQIWIDRLLAWGLGGGVALLAWLTGNHQEFPPELFDRLAVAAGLRPPVHPFPLFWPGVLSFLIKTFGLASCLDGLKILGPVSLGFLTVLTFHLLIGCLPNVMRTDMSHSRWGRGIVRLVLIQVTLFFICSEPVWLAGRVLSPEMTALLFSVALILLAVLTVEKSRPLGLVALGAFSGFFAADIPIGFLPPLFCGLFIYLKYAHLEDTNNPPPLANPIIFTLSVRWTAAVFLLCWLTGCALNLTYYLSTGARPEDLNLFLLCLKYLLRHLTIIREAVTPMGGLLIVSVVLLPLVILVAKIRAFTDMQRLIPLPALLFLLLAGTLAFLQSTGFSNGHFWRWTPDAFHSRYTVCLCLLGTSLTVFLTLCVLAVDVFFRNHARLIRDQFPDALDEEPLTARLLHACHTIAKWMRRPLHLEPILALALVLPFRFDTSCRDMAALVNDVIRQTADECAGVPLLFSDGSLDAAVETAAAQKGRALKALSMMSGSGAHELALRVRGETNTEHRALLKIGVSDALRTWVQDHHPVASNIAVQVGLELWRHHNLPLPETGGLVSRTAGFPPGAAETYAAAAHRLCERFLALYEKGDPLSVGYPELNRYLLFSQWRLSRMCRIRANEADRNNETTRSEAEHALADKLDSHNAEWQRVQEKMDWIGRQNGMRLTPREGLKLGLERADFRLARAYARRILTTNPDDVPAHFALGMGFFTEKQYGRAEIHLKHCLLKAPDEPAVLNNLAIVQLRLGRFAEAETNALHALRILPHSSEIKTTLRHIHTAREKADAHAAGKEHSREQK
jgi:tetratricopeptide (TPR) repeat protein